MGAPGWLAVLKCFQDLDLDNEAKPGEFNALSNLNVDTTPRWIILKRTAMMIDNAA
jgi:hypothetical protein